MILFPNKLNIIGPFRSQTPTLLKKKNKNNKTSGPHIFLQICAVDGLIYKFFMNDPLIIFFLSYFFISDSAINNGN